MNLQGQCVCCFFLARMFSLGCFHCRNTVQHYVFFGETVELFSTVTYRIPLWVTLACNFGVLSSCWGCDDHFYCALVLFVQVSTFLLRKKPEFPASHQLRFPFLMLHRFSLFGLVMNVRSFVWFSRFAALPVPVLDYQELNLWSIFKCLNLF